MMASRDGVWLSCLNIFTVLLILSEKSSGKRTQTYYMDGADCGNTKYLGGATIYSHNSKNGFDYSHKIECRITMKAENDDWKLMARLEYIDIPDVTFNSICNDALYIYDSRNILTAAIAEAGGNGGLCGTRPPPVISSTGPYMTIYFRSDRHGPVGTGFKLIVTAYSEDYRKYGNCGGNFQCGNRKCIDIDLVCDNVKHCSDGSDETCGQITTEGASDVNPTQRPDDLPTEEDVDSTDEGGKGVFGDLWSKLMSMGVAAAVGIVAGSVVVVIVCIVCTICLCRRCAKKKEDDPNITTGPPQTNNLGADQFNMNQNIGHTGVMPPAVPHLQMYPAGTNYYPVTQPHPAYTQQPGYAPMIRDRESYSQSSAYSSLPPHSLQSSGYTPTSQPMHTRPTRSLTPTSSKSGNSKSDVTYHSNPEKVGFPVHL